MVGLYNSVGGRNPENSHTTIRTTSPKQQIQDDSLDAKSKTFHQSIEGTAFHNIFFAGGMKLHLDSHQTFLFRSEELR